MVIPNPWLSAVRFTSTHSCLHSWGFVAHFEDQKPLFLLAFCLLLRIDAVELAWENDERVLPSPLYPDHGEFLPTVLVPRLFERGLRTLEYKPEKTRDKLYMRLKRNCKQIADCWWDSNTFSGPCSTPVIRPRLTLQVYISTGISDQFRDFFVRARVIHEGSSSVIVSCEVAAWRLGKSPT